MGIDIRRQSTEEEIQMSKQHMTRNSTSPVTKEMQT